jgi:transcriptional regulator with XRE-family HTH domain
VHTFTNTRLPDPSSPSPPALTGLGQALRWLRERQARKQYRVADDAGITKGMLSAYETGRQRPSLETLDRLLGALGSDLNDLHNALQIVNGRPERMKGWSGWQALEPSLPAPLPGDGYTVHELGPGLPGAGWPGAGLPNAGSAAAGELHEPPPQASYAGPAQAESAATDADTARASSAIRDLYRVLGWDQPRLAAEEEQALGQMLDGFHSLLRYWHRSLVEIGDIGKAGDTPAINATEATGASGKTGGPEKVD